MFRVGQKVVCVDAMPKPTNSLGMHGLAEKMIYTIRRISGGSVWLEEILRPSGWAVCRLFAECPYDARRFRPLVERKTDISVFTALLNPTKQIERA